MVKEHENTLYIFAACMRNQAVSAEFTIAGSTGSSPVKVEGQDRNLTVQQGTFSDDFGPYGINIYTLSGLT
jgi:hypothetical protein